MKLLAASITLACLCITCLAQEFTLQDDKGKTNGPFVLKVGAEVAIGSNKAVISAVGTQKMERMFVQKFRNKGWSPRSPFVTEGMVEKANTEMQSDFAENGVTWLVGSWIKNDLEDLSLTVCNTRENLKLIEKLVNPKPRQIQIDA